MQAPQVTVYAADLGGKAPVALKDSTSEFRLAIDFSQPPEKITASLTQIFQDNVDARVWTRREAPDGGGGTDR
ncbi:hypothetical protein [Streptomyces fumanus]|uniref:Uncharacterized protein n=1 Tax=Streptomyces fumanus TaxID=67302 RepID=A0A919DWD8_9ACTN|nr:hypothetical protein [Streptomyces fumanus]GHE84736.1 hypothetical protein GCM10018772_04740 [Streptomyces fumanus]